MKPFLLLLTISAALAGGWWIGREGHTQAPAEPAANAPLYYQSPMHPWIRSDKPGKCTICGMDLAPVYDSGSGPGATAANIVMLPGESPRITGIATAPVVKGPLRRTLRVAGRLEVDRRGYYVLAAPVRGRIDSLPVREVGERVEAGKPLAELFSRELLAVMAEYRATPTGALREAAAFRLRQMGLTPEQIAAVPSGDAKALTVPLLAPKGGVVVSRKVDEGQWVNEGEAMLEVADLATLWFLFPVYEDDLPWLAPGQEVVLQTPAVPGESFRARITLIDPNVDEASRTVRVRAELANPLVPLPGGGEAYQLRNRLYAEGEVILNTRETLLVPRSAVLRPGGGARVFVQEEEGTYRLAPVQLGQEGDEAVEVLHGLKEGERVVTRGGVLLDGQAQLNHPEGAVPDGVLSGDQCPVSEEKLGSMGEPYRFEHAGHTISLCCKACLGDFNANPDQYLRKLP